MDEPVTPTIPVDGFIVSKSRKSATSAKRSATSTQVTSRTGIVTMTRSGCKSLRSPRDAVDTQSVNGSGEVHDRGFHRRSRSEDPHGIGRQRQRNDVDIGEFGHDPAHRFVVDAVPRRDPFVEDDTDVVRTQRIHTRRIIDRCDAVNLNLHRSSMPYMNPGQAR